jgi:hypothetical protein
MSILSVLLGLLLLAATVEALFLWELGTKRFELEVQDLEKNSLQSRALEYGWDLMYDCSCTKANSAVIQLYDRTGAQCESGTLSRNLADGPLVRCDLGSSSSVPS